MSKTSSAIFVLIAHGSLLIAHRSQLNARLQWPEMPVSPARAAAFDIVLRVERESSYASDLLHSAHYERLSTQDHSLATELVMGVLRWQSRLDDEISRVSSQKLTKLDVQVLIALRLAVYQ